LLAGTHFLTHLLSATEYGKLSLTVSLSALAVQVCANPISQTITRFYAHWSKAGKLMILIIDLKKSLATVASGICFICLAIALLGNYCKKNPDFYFIFAAGSFAILLVINNVALSMENAARERRFRGIVQGGFEFTRFFLAIGLILLLGKTDAKTALSGFVVAASLAVVIHFFFIFNLLKKNSSSTGVSKIPTESTERGLLKSFRFPLILSNGCIWIMMMSERWALMHFGSLPDVGGYAAIHQLAFVPMLFISSFFVLIAEPIMYQIVGLDKKQNVTSRVFRVNSYLAIAILALTFMIFFALFFCHSKIAVFFLGTEFHSYSWIFPWLSLAGGLYAAAQQLLIQLNCEMRTKKLATLWGILASISIVLYSIGAVYWQLKGILTAVVVVNGLLFLFTLAFIGKESFGQ